MPTYSHSRLSTFEKCPLKFKFRYIDKIVPEIEVSIEIHLGSAVHTALEWLYFQIKEKKLPSLDEVIIYYSDTWVNEFKQDILIVDKTKSAKDYFNKGIKFLIDYYTKYHPFEDGTIALEERIIIDLDGTGNYKIQGFIDRLAQNIHTGDFEIHDYKTGNYLPPQNQFDQDRQLALYSIAIKESFGKDKKVKLIWHYLAHNKKIVSTRTDEQLETLRQSTINLIKQIESTTTFPAKKSALCEWCEYKSICSAWGNFLNKEKQVKLQKFYKEIVEKEEFVA